MMMMPVELSDEHEYYYLLLLLSLLLDALEWHVIVDSVSV